MGSVVAWSGGKDAACALYTLRQAGVDTLELMTTINQQTGRSSMHGVRRSLYKRQADAIDLPINLVSLPANPSNEEYNEIMAEELESYVERGFEEIVFADIYLEDVRSYRENQLDGTNVSGRWPLWGQDTAVLAAEFIDAGFRATVVAINGGSLDRSLLGHDYDHDFLEKLPEEVDPCGENGEFHTFVWDGPIFTEQVQVTRTKSVTKTLGEAQYHFQELELRA